MSLFEKTFPNGGEVNLENVTIATENGLDISWAAQYLLCPTALKDYEAIRAPAWKDYEAIRDTALKDYEAIRDTAWKDYEAIRATAFVHAWGVHEENEQA